MAKFVQKQPTSKLATTIAVVLGVAALFGSKTTARAEVYYYKDRNGVFHFTKTRLPGSRPFRLQETKERRHSPVRKRPALAKAIAKSSAGNDAYDHLIVRHADRYGVDPALVKAVIHAESNFRRTARSRVGARGLMQLMPRTARAYGVGAQNLYDPHHNIRAGVRHLQSLLSTFRGNVRLAVAAYNAGTSRVKRHKGVPPFRETRRYVAKVLRYQVRYSRQAALAQADTGHNRG